MSNNFITKKTTQNAHLLTLLTHRQRAKSVPNLRNDWPGKNCPNFAVTARFTKHSHTNNTPIQIKQFQSTKKSIGKDLTSVRIPQSGNLELRPFRNLNKRGSLSGRKSMTHGSSRKQGVFKIQENEDARSVVSIFRNSKIANKVSEIIDNELMDSVREDKLKESWQKVLKKKSLIAFMDTQEKPKSKLTIRRQAPAKESKPEFKIDYLAFGYIEKVIQNPQLWGKFVHKIENNRSGNYLTSV